MLTDEVRALLRDMQQAINDRQRAQETTARRLALLLRVATLALLVVCATLPLVGSHVQPDLVQLMQPLGLSSTSVEGQTLEGVSSWQQIAGVEIWGAVGALMSGVVAVRGVRPRLGDEGLSVAQLVLKLPAGSLTAAFAILLIQADVVPLLRPIEHGQVGAYAVLFGFAQEAVTRLIDRQAASLLDKSANL